ncbi:MAG: hypothetical protein H6746_20160 [Deltaproteobacteria bacterium]|nr:hypothetical protein [Deltaproteobacteria bacterium]
MTARRATRAKAGDGEAEAEVPVPRERIVRLLRESAALEELLERLTDAGRIGQARPAGDGRAAMIGAALALEPGDLLLGSARDLPAAVARGASLELVLRQAFAVSGDPALGRGLPGALQDATLGVRLGDGSAAAHLVHAAGFGHAARLRGQPRVALALFGSAAQAHGDLHAALGFAAVYRAQTVFVARGPIQDELWLDEIAQGWGIRAERVAGDDGGAVLQAVARARRRAISGEGPAVIDARLGAPAAPRDEEAWRNQTVQDAASVHAVAEDVRQRLGKARAAAEAASPVAPGTLTAEVYAERPWFLQTAETELER